jgi:phosphoribosylformylglycinamidine synthase
MKNSDIYLAKVKITLRKSILDPQGKAVHHALESLGLKAVEDVRIGKYVEVKVHADDQQQAERMADEACKRLLANMVMEDYSFTVEKI